MLCLQPPAQAVLPPPPRPQATPARPSKEARGGMSSREARLTARNAPDNHQVFIGNLPPGVKDDDVRNVFSSEYHKKVLCSKKKSRVYLISFFLSFATFQSLEQYWKSG